ncbi:hypothetical protein, partial [Psychrobacter sp. 1Y4]|uniref:hypothetical protein n=1 Tax=Psychrobacter sp. 1Y4 TaxID=3453575 RepID=UPI003F446F4E
MTSFISKPLPQGTPQAAFKVSALVLALSAMSLATHNAQAAVSYNLKGEAIYSTLGDLSIYQPPKGETKPTVMLMLDKSGSMNSDSLWDDYGSFDYQRESFTRVENIEVTKYRLATQCNRGGNNCYQYWQAYQVIEPTDVTYNYQTPNLKGRNDQPCYFGSPDTINFISESRTDDGY